MLVTTAGLPQAAIIGLAQTGYVSVRDDVSLQELIFEAASGALLDAGVNRRDLDAVVLASQDVTDGRGISNMSNAGAAGAYMKDEIRVADDGIYGLILAALQIAAGRSELTLVVSWNMASESEPALVSSVELDPFFQRALGFSEATALALQATALSLRDPSAVEAATASVQRDRAAGSKNENAVLQAELASAEVDVSSQPVSWPLRDIDLCPPTDGACAVVVASSANARRTGRPLAWIAGVGWSTEPYQLGDRELTSSRSARTAADEAYRLAGLSGADQVDVVELSTKSSFQEIVLVEALGLCEPGLGAEYIVAHRTDPARRPVVNPSGGTRSAYPAASAGLDRVVEAARQVTGRAGPRQVDSARVALAHGSSGQCLQSNGVVVLRSEPDDG